MSAMTQEQREELERKWKASPRGRYSPVFSLGTGWIIGVIDNHVAKPFQGRDRQESLSFACDAVNALPQLLADSAALADANDELSRVKAVLTDLVEALDHRGCVDDAESELAEARKLAQTQERLP